MILKLQNNYSARCLELLSKGTYEEIEGFKSTNVGELQTGYDLKKRYEENKVLEEIIKKIEKRYFKIEQEYKKVFGGKFFEETYQQLSSSKEVINMDWQEKYLDKLDQNITEMKQSLRDTENRIAQMINQTLSEIRDRDNQRHQEFLHINQKVDYFTNSVDKKIDEIRKEIKEDRKWIIGIAVTTILGVAAMVITVLFK